MLANDPKHFPLALRSLYVRSSSTRMKDAFDPFIPNQQLTARFRNEDPTVIVKQANEDVAGAVNLPVCTFLHKFDFEYVSGGPETSVENDAALVAEVKVTLAVDYFVRGTMPSAQELDIWGRTSALIHAWPYWREFCHAALGRMSLPTILMPMLDVQTVAETKHVVARKKKTTSSKAKQ